MPRLGAKKTGFFKCPYCHDTLIFDHFEDWEKHSAAKHGETGKPPDESSEIPEGPRVFWCHYCQQETPVNEVVNHLQSRHLDKWQRLSSPRQRAFQSLANRWRNRESS